MKPQPIHDFPALLARARGENILAICDIHLGIEDKYLKAGAYVKPATEKLIRQLKTIINSNSIDRLVIVGDVKHTIPFTTLMETREVPKFFSAMTVDRIEIVIGNHDARLKELIKLGKYKANIRFHKDAFTLDELAFVHGHKWPPKKVFTKKYVICAHNHPTVELDQGIGVSMYEPCWIRTKFIEKKVKEHYPEFIFSEDQEFIVMPAIIGSSRGVPFNSKGVRLLGPMLTNKLVDLKNAKMHLLSGVELGSIKHLM